jgi:hypothetical protein
MRKKSLKKLDRSVNENEDDAILDKRLANALSSRRLSVSERRA